jgi:hypothetical protein
MSAKEPTQTMALQIGILIAGGLKGISQSKGNQEFADAVNQYTMDPLMREVAASFAAGLGLKINDVSTYAGVVLGVMDNQSPFRYKASMSGDLRLLHGAILCTILALYFPDQAALMKSRLEVRPAIRPEEVHQRMSEMSEALKARPEMFEWANEDEQEVWAIVEDRKRISRTDSGQHRADSLMGQIESAFRLLEENRMVQARTSDGGREYIPFPRLQQYMEDVGNMTGYAVIRKMMVEAEALRRPGREHLLPVPGGSAEEGDPSPVLDSHEASQEAAGTLAAEPGADPRLL